MSKKDMQNRGDGIYYNIGYQCLGPLLVGFCQLLKSKRESEHLDKLLFFARDGFIMQKAYNILYPNEKSSYVYISRRSVTVPQLVYAKDWNDVVKTVGYIKRVETWETLLHKMGIDNNNEVLILLKKRFGADVSKMKLLHSPEYVDAFNLIKPLMEQNAKHEMFEARNYLDPFFVGTVGIVDIGWYGTMQQILNQFYHKKVLVKGYYIGLLKREGYNPENMYGYIFDYLRKNEYDDKLIYGFNGLIESFFSADHGSTKKYKDSTPILEDWESENWPIISKVHEGALQFCEFAKGNIIEYGKILTPEEAFSPLLRFLTKPTQKEIEAFGKIVFFDTYYEPLIKYSGIFTYILHPKRILSDLMKSNWKIGFIKKLTKLPMSDKIYLMLMKLK